MFIPVISSLSFPPCHFLPVISSLSFPPCHFLPVISSLSFPPCHFLPVISSMLFPPCYFIPVYNYYKDDQSRVPIIYPHIKQCNIHLIHLIINKSPQTPFFSLYLSLNPTSLNPNLRSIIRALILPLLSLSLTPPQI